MMAKRKEKTMPFFKYLVITIFIITLITLGLFKFINVLPGEYFAVLSVLLLLINGVLALLILRRGPKKRALGTVLGILFLILLILVIIYELNTIGFLKKLGFVNYQTENYSVLVLKDSEYEEIGDLDNALLGALNFSDNGDKLSKEKLEKKIKVDFEDYSDVVELKAAFNNKTVEGILIENSVLAMIDESDADFANSYKVIYEFSIDVETEDITNDVDITNEAFNIYISGIDTYGSVSSVSRIDVNMIVTVNPNTHKILITSIPRDYYVELASKKQKDKLTHAGIYGVDESVKTLENLLDIKINYYVKVNFTSLINIVDALGGVNVYSNYSFTSLDGYYYNKGYNKLDGKEALSFVRERKSFAKGDRVRVENQAAMVKALIEKATSPSIIIKYNSLLDALDDSFITNLNMDNLTDFIKMQIDENPSWEITNISLNGTDGYEYTYSYGSYKLYVMIPDNDTVINAKAKIEEVMNTK